MRLDRNRMHTRSGWCIVEDNTDIVWTGSLRAHACRVCAAGRKAGHAWRVARMLVIHVAKSDRRLLVNRKADPAAVVGGSASSEWLGADTGSERKP